MVAILPESNEAGLVSIARQCRGGNGHAFKECEMMINARGSAAPLE